MTENDLKVLDTIGTPEYLKGSLSDSGLYSVFPSESLRTEVSPHTAEMDIPAHMVPPNPDDSDSSYSVPFLP